jgi:hypothetical protein
MLAWYFQATLRAPFRSALTSYRHDWPRKMACVGLFRRCTCPHVLQRWLVCRGSTAATIEPTASAVSVTKPPSWAQLDPRCRRRRRRPSLLGACADLGQVFDHDHAARPGTRNPSTAILLAGRSNGRGRRDKPATTAMSRSERSKSAMAADGSDRNVVATERALARRSHPRQSLAMVWASSGKEHGRRLNLGIYGPSANSSPKARNRPSDISRRCAADSDGFGGIATTYAPSRLQSPDQVRGRPPSQA